MNREDLEKIIEQIKDCSFLISDGFYKDSIENIEKAFEKKPFRIALVGEFSTGKSTFINALIGRDLLLHATEEVTATILFLVKILFHILKRLRMILREKII